MKISVKKANHNANHKNTNIPAFQGGPLKYAVHNASYKKRRGSTGQLSIFILLVFPTLFMLFAMSLNIALVVHDKINLQNSVDIAAYYGAMKQAEMLNAIAHINYQIRQSWKLLTWRYRVLGSMGLTKVDANWGRQYDPSQIDEFHPLPAFLPPNRLKGPYFFCVGHYQWGGLLGTPQSTVDTQDDLLCKNMDFNIPGLSRANVGGNLDSLTTVLKSIDSARDRIHNILRERCDVYGFNSWLLGALSFAHFYLDQSHRKKMIYAIAKALMDNTEKDIDGKEISTGVRNTFERNLSFINKKAMSQTTKPLEQFSSLIHKQPQDLIQDQPFFVTGLYSQFEKDPNEDGGCDKKFNYVDNSVSKGKVDISDTLVQLILGFVNSHNHQSWPVCAKNEASEILCQPSAGLKKNENLIIYYGVKAELDYESQIFLPFKLSLKAKAFAKPFGGRIGPNNPTGPNRDRADGLLSSYPPQEIPSIPDQNKRTFLLQLDQLVTPNYSRYPGDNFGLRSQLVHHYWAEHVKKIDNKYKKNIKNYLKAGRFPTDRDPMARNFQLSTPGIDIPARKWEIAAVAPDLFDVTYFTILPYYQYDYFPRLVNGILAGKNYVRGDLGTYCDTGSCNKASDFQGTSVLEQVIDRPLAGTQIQSVWNELQAQSHPPPFIRPAYKIAKLDLLLTGWNPPKTKYDNNMGYNSIGNTYFGKCQDQGWVHNIDGLMNQPQQQQPPRKGKIANGCIFGGRTGYSVKMIHQDTLTSPSPPDGW